METVVKALYNASFTIWNTLMSLAMTLFSASPTSAAGGSPYGTVHGAKGYYSPTDKRIVINEGMWF